MGEEKLVTEVCPIVMQLATGEEIQGEIFLQLVGLRGFGEQRLEELLNGEDCFLPVRCAGDVTLVNLRQIASISVPDDQHNNTLMKLGVRHLVSVRTTVGKSFEAEIYVNLPSNRTRVKDFLNQKQRFFPFFADNRLIYLNFRYILQVRD
jgi:hypothetical protein